ncbi:MAG: alpha/beta hydrolase, partial [Bacteroidota bacterium]
PTSFRVTNDEIYYLEDELKDMLPLWKDIQIPATIIQGGKDSLVPAENADFARKMLINSPDVDIVLVEDMNHFVPWSNPELIREAILRHLTL